MSPTPLTTRTPAVHLPLEPGMEATIHGRLRSTHDGLLLELRVPAGIDERRLAMVELKYKDHLQRTNQVHERSVRVRYAADASSSAASLNPSVRRTVQAHEAGADLLRASRLVAARRFGPALQVLRERRQLLQRAADQLDEPDLRRDASRFDELVALTERGRANPRALGLLMATAGRHRLR